MICKICGNEEKNMVYNVKERQLNKGDEFRYLYCSRCGTLQLYDEIDNIEKYYPSNYYSFHMKGSGKIFVPMVIKKTCVRFISNCPFWLPGILENLLRDIMYSLMLLYGTCVKSESAILDVGGGNGRWLDTLYHWGFQNLSCIDLFSQSSFHTITFRQCDIRDLDDEIQYDLITFHHSFEHMSEPESVLHKIKKILNPDGVCLIRVPVCECEVWNIYHENWYQIDAPRHYYLYTERAMRMLCEKVGLQVYKVVYDSGLGQAIISEYYEKTDLSLKEIQEKTKQEQKKFRRKKWSLNKSGKGDQAAFYIKHKEAIKKYGN